jgi:hypothetical protein
MDLVAGKKRVPKPPTGKMALRTLRVAGMAMTFRKHAVNQYSNAMNNASRPLCQA